ncbi:unnamed protein product [Hymenolepis diminuta]|uniref:Uncharacterized protein n=1 Tax=Hymenolepis diminuta TaxID=6216 RepID=A0A564YCK8_HYMDI|nr:unnamed protein product [Hymenolepis diminuta]
MVERQKQEFDIISNCVNFSLGGHWFRIHSRNDSYLYLDIVPIPRGHVTLFAPPAYPHANASWTVMIGDKRVSDHNFQYPVQAKTMLQAFLASVFVITKHLNLEMPEDVIRIDPLFFHQLNSMLPADYVDRILSFL